MKLAIALLTLFVAVNAHANSGSPKVGKLLEPSGPAGVGKSELMKEFFKEFLKEQELRNNPPVDKKSENDLENSEADVVMAAGVEPSDAGLKRILSRPRPLAPKEPVKPAQSSELNIETSDQSADASS